MIRCEVIGDCRLYLGDCRDVMPTLGKFDLLLTDPPYGIDVGSMGMGKGKKATGFDKFDWDATTPSDETILIAPSPPAKPAEPTK